MAFYRAAIGSGGSGGVNSITYVAKFCSYGTGYRDMIVYETSRITKVKAYLISGTNNNNIVVGYTNTRPSGTTFPTLSSQQALNNCDITVDTSYTYLVIGTKDSGVNDAYYDITVTFNNSSSSNSAKYDKYIGINHGSGATNFACSYVDLTQVGVGATASAVTSYTSPEGVKLTISNVSGYNFTLTITPPTGKNVDIEFISGGPASAISVSQTISAAKSITQVNRFGVLFYKILE